MSRSAKCLRHSRRQLFKPPEAHIPSPPPFPLSPPFPPNSLALAKLFKLIGFSGLGLSPADCARLRSYLPLQLPLLSSFIHTPNRSHAHPATVAFFLLVGLYGRLPSSRYTLPSLHPSDFMGAADFPPIRTHADNFPTPLSSRACPYYVLSSLPGFPTSPRSPHR